MSIDTYFIQALHDIAVCYNTHHNLSIPQGLTQNENKQFSFPRDNPTTIDAPVSDCNGNSNRNAKLCCE